MSNPSTPNASNTPSTSSKKVPSARPAPRPYKEGIGWAMRQQYKNNDVYVSGCKTAEAATKALRRKLVYIDNNMKAAGRGADKTTLAQALQDYALGRLPFLKGAEQEARRINHYLRYARLQTLVATPHIGQPTEGKKKSGDTIYFDITLEEHTDERKIVNSLKKHRKAQMTSNARTEKYRAVLATTAVSAVSRNMLQDFVDAMRRDGNAASTISLERSMLRVLFFHAVTTWDSGNEAERSSSAPSSVRRGVSSKPQSAAAFSSRRRSSGVTMRYRPISDNRGTSNRTGREPWRWPRHTGAECRANRLVRDQCH